MTSMPAPRPRVKPRPKVSRTVHLLSPSLLRVVEGKDADLYHLERVPCEFGLGFLVAKVLLADELGVEHAEPYQTLVDVTAEQRHSCSCKGFGRWNHCRHVEAVAALHRAGKLV